MARDNHKVQEWLGQRLKMASTKVKTFEWLEQRWRMTRAYGRKWLAHQKMALTGHRNPGSWDTQSRLRDTQSLDPNLALSTPGREIRNLSTLGRENLSLSTPGREIRNLSTPGRETLSRPLVQRVCNLSTQGREYGSINPGLRGSIMSRKFHVCNTGKLLPCTDQFKTFNWVWKFQNFF